VTHFILERPYLLGRLPSDFSIQHRDRKSPRPNPGHIPGPFAIPMTGAVPIALLTGGLYLNFHSQVFAGGEVHFAIPLGRGLNRYTRGQTIPCVRTTIPPEAVSR